MFFLFFLLVRINIRVSFDLSHVFFFLFKLMHHTTHTSFNSHCSLHLDFIIMRITKRTSITKYCNFPTQTQKLALHNFEKTAYTMGDLYRWWWLFGIVSFCLIGCVLILLMILTNLYGFDCCLTDVSQITKPIRSVTWLSTLSLLAFTLTCASQAYIILNISSDAQISDSVIMEINALISLISWTLGQLFIYLLFIANLHHTFKNTNLKLSNRVLIFLIISICVFCLCRIGYITLYTLYFKEVITDAQVHYPLALMVCGTEIMDLIVSIILVYLFINRLFKLVQSQPNNYKRRRISYIRKNIDTQPLLIQESKTKTNTNTDLSVIEEYHGMNYSNIANSSHDHLDPQKRNPNKYRSETQSTIEIDDNQETILGVASKYVVLSTFAIVSTQFFLMIAVMEAISFDSLSGEFYLISFGIYYSFLALDCFINALCICLNFEYNIVWFWSICCICDNWCYSICLCLSKRKLRNNYTSNK